MPPVSQVSLPDFRLAVQQRQSLTSLIARGDSESVSERRDDPIIRSDRPRDESRSLSRADNRIEDEEDDDRPPRAEDLPTDFAAALNAALSAQPKSPVESPVRKSQDPEISEAKAEVSSGGVSSDEQAAAAAARLREQQAARLTNGDRNTANSNPAATLKTSNLAAEGEFTDTQRQSDVGRAENVTAESSEGVFRKDGVDTLQKTISNQSEAASDSISGVSQQSLQNSSAGDPQVTGAGTKNQDLSQTKSDSVENQKSSAKVETTVSDRQPLPANTPSTVLSPEDSVDAGLYEVTGVKGDQSRSDRETVRSNAEGRADSPARLLKEGDQIKGARDASDRRGDSDADIRKALSTAEIVRDVAGASSLLTDRGEIPTSSTPSVSAEFQSDQRTISISNSVLGSQGEPEDLAAVSISSAGESVVADRLVNARPGSVLQSVSGSDTTMNAGNSAAGVSVSQSFTESPAGESRLPMTSQVSRAVYELVQRQSGNENSSLTLRLDPPTLGELVIQLSKTEDGIAARVTASEPVTMDMLLARGAEIESQLKSQDLNFSGIEFLGPGAGGGDSGQSARRNAFAEGSENGKRSRGNGTGAVSGSVTNSGRGQVPQRASGMSFRA